MPEDFGSFGIALLILSTLEKFSNTGFQTALIQKKDNISGYLNTAWSISMLRGFVLYLIVYFSAPYIAIFFKNPESTIIIQIIGITIILRGLLNVGTVYFQKELEFNKQFVFQFTSTFVEFVVSVMFAIILKNVWTFEYAGNITLDNVPVNSVVGIFDIR